MAGILDALKPKRFARGDHFERWQTHVKFWLMSTNIWWVISPVLPLTEERHCAFELDNTTIIGCIVSLLSDQLCDIYMEYTMVSELWEALNRKYVESDGGCELYVNDQYHEYRMVDDHSIVEKAHEIQLLIEELAHFICALPDRFVVGGIIAKLPPSWRSFATSLKHKREVMTIENLISTFDVEEKSRSKDVPRSGPSDGACPSNGNVAEGKSDGNKNKNWKGKAKQNIEFKKKKKSLADPTCFVCGETGHIARKYRNRKGKKVGGQNSMVDDCNNVANLVSYPELKVGETAVWHSCLCHINFDRIIRLTKVNLILKNPVVRRSKCHACVQAKQQRKPFKSVEEKSLAPLDLIHSDLCEMNGILTRTVEKYFISFIDDATRYCQLYLIKTKDEALNCFKIYKEEVENQLERKIKWVRSDRGGEYLSNDFGEYCAEHGIIHETTTPYSPQSNGVAERKN
jgi:hypothetical protein